MKLVSFELAGLATYGLIDGDHVKVVADTFRQEHPDLKSVLAAGALDELNHACREVLSPDQAGNVKKRPVLSNPGKIFCVGLNYKTHVAETKRPDSEYPSIFTRFADSLAADGDVLVCPAVSRRFDF